MYAPTQGPVNTGFAQTVIEAKATGSALKRGHLVSIGFNADGAPSATLTTFANDAGRPTPVGVAGEDINQGFNGSVIIAGVADVLIPAGLAGTTKPRLEAAAGVTLGPGDGGQAQLRIEQPGFPAAGITTEIKSTVKEYVPMAFSSFARTQSSSGQSENSTASARISSNTLVPEPGIANRITLSEAWEPDTSTFVTTFKESFFQAHGGTNATGDVQIIDSSARNGIRSLYEYGGYSITHTGALRSLPFDSTASMAGFAVTTTGDVTYHRGSSVDDTDDGYFVWITYSERAS